MNFIALLEKAQTSKWGMWKLNFLLQRFIPFNKPHGLKIISIDLNEVKVMLPYKKNNLNHLKGLHACSLATAAEYASGLLLLYRLDVKNYRIIMESIKVEYKYQGKSDAIATFSISDEEFKSTVLEPVEKEGAIYKKCNIKVRDQEENLLCEVTTNWQIKSWKKVKTKLN